MALYSLPYNGLADIIPHPLFVQLFEIEQCLSTCDSLPLFPYVAVVNLWERLVSTLDAVDCLDLGPVTGLCQKSYKAVLCLLDQVAMWESSYRLQCT